MSNDLILLEDLPGREYAKRAVEVCAVGDHSIMFIATLPNEYDAYYYNLWLNQNFKLSPYGNIVTPCNCGFHGDVNRTCICTPDEITKHRVEKILKYQHGNTMEMVVEIGDIKFEDLLLKRRRETNEIVLKRIAEARSRKPVSSAIEDLDESCVKLLRSAYAQLAFSSWQVESILSVAATIARMDSAKTIKPAHLAEALVYRTKI